MNTTQFKKALLEAADWINQATEKEYKELSFADAREAVIDRIMTKYLLLELSPPLAVEKEIIITDYTAIELKKPERLKNPINPDKK